MTDLPRLAWFSPLPPTRSGISAYTAELLPHLERDYTIETFDEAHAHDFVWKHRRDPYQLSVFQLGNAPCHDYMWGYLAAYPGLVVLHDARVHHARAQQLLQANRADDYRHEFWYDHPAARRDVVDYVVAGIGGCIYYFWPMRRVVIRTARAVAVHNARVAAELRDEHPGAAVETIRMGVPRQSPAPGARASLRASLSIAEDAIVFAAFGKMTAEKRVAQIIQALAALATSGDDVHLLLVGDEAESPLWRHSIPPWLAGRVHVIGYVADEAIASYLEASDICLALRWPTAQEMSASWLRCLAAGRATIVTDLAHTADVPATVARRVDLLDEDRSLVAAMRELAADATTRSTVARAGREWWAAHHTMDAMAADYRRAIDRAIAQPAPHVADLPFHFVDDHGALARAITRRFDLDVDITRPNPVRFV
jgi:glycosyltransferase involved in cell wall biosynthesis